MRDKLKAERMEKHLTGRGLTQLAGVTQGAYSLWEQGKATPSVHNALRLARALDTTVEDLFGGEVDG